MRPDLTTWRPVGDSVAARLRSAPAELLIEWEAALVELRRHYWADDRTSCPLCAMIVEVYPRGKADCILCPWITFEGAECDLAKPPYDLRTNRRRIADCGRWLKRIRAEIRARGI